MEKLVFLKSEKGSSTVIFAAATVFILALVSITIDIGMMTSEKAKLVNATDAAVLAAAQELLENSDNAVNVAEQYLEENGLPPQDAQISVSDDGRSVTVLSNKEVDFFFAGVLGYDKGNVSAVAEARVMPVTAVSSGVRPFAIEDQVLNFGEQYILKEGAGGGSGGNYGPLALGGSGASNYRENIVYGYDETIEVGDLVDTETGNMSGPTEWGIDKLISSCDHCPKCTFESYEPDCPRVITVVVVDSLDVSGKKSVKVVGFASFFLEGVEGNGNESIIKGRFIENLTQGELSDNQADYGLKGIKLVR